MHLNKFFIWIALIVYAAILSKLILFKRPLGYIKDHFLHDYNMQNIRSNFKHANFIPFYTIRLYLNTKLRAEYSIENLLGNIIIFIPLGMLIPLLFSSTRSLWKIFAISLLASFFFEVVQLLTVLGSFDVDDLILNTTGGMIGYGLFKFLGLKYFSQKEQVKNLT